MTGMRFDELILTSILSGLMIEELDHTITTFKDSFSVLMDYHYIFLGVTDGLWDQLELFQ